MTKDREELLKKRNDKESSEITFAIKIEQLKKEKEEMNEERKKQYKEKNIHAKVIKTIEDEYTKENN